MLHLRGALPGSRYHSQGGLTFISTKDISDSHLKHLIMLYGELATPSLPTEIMPAKTAWLKLSRKIPMGLGNPKSSTLNTSMGPWASGTEHQAREHHARAPVCDCACLYTWPFLPVQPVSEGTIWTTGSPLGVEYLNGVLWSRQSHDSGVWDSYFETLSSWLRRDRAYRLLHRSQSTCQRPPSLFPTKNFQGLSSWDVPLFRESSPLESKTLTRGCANKCDTS